MPPVTAQAPPRRRRAASRRHVLPDLGAEALDALRRGYELEGRVSTDRRNRLLYRTGSPGGPQRVLALDGTWALTPAHDLAFTVHGSQAAARQTIHLRGALERAGAHQLVFALRRGAAESRAAERLTLAGRWHADTRNRLVFLVEKADGSADRLTLQGGWQVGPRHEILYQYRQPAGVLAATVRTLRFTGTWDVTARDRLVFHVEGADNSTFEFRASLRSPVLNARDGRIVYEVGVGAARRRTAPSRVVFFGRWKLHRDLAVSFELAGAGGRPQSLRFEGTYALTPRHELEVELLGRRGEPLGLAVTFSRHVMENGRGFLRVRRRGPETEAVGGLQWRF